MYGIQLLTAPPASSSNPTVTTIASGSLPAAATLDLTSIAATYRQLQLVLLGASCDTTTRSLQVEISVDNGSNWLATNYDTVYAGSSASSDTTRLVTTPTIANTTAQDLSLMLFFYQGGAYPSAVWNVRNSVGSTAYFGTSTYIGGTSAVNAIRVLWNSTGSFDAGTYALYGVR